MSSNTKSIAALLGLSLYTASKFLFAADPEGTKKFLEDQGYTSVEADGTAILNCGIIAPHDDYFSTSFTAQHPVTKKTVSGGVCSGFFKGQFIRLDHS